MRLLKSWKWMAIILLASTITWGQTSPDLEQGLKPYGSYHGGNLDRISLTNGNLFFQADLMPYSQRGGELAYPIILQYNNKAFSLFEQPCGSANPGCVDTLTVIFGPNPLRTQKKSNGNSVTIGYEGLPGVGYGFVDTSVAFDGNEIYLHPPTVLMPDGSTHQLVTTDSGLITVDGSGYAVPNNGSLTGRDGTRYSSAGNFAEDHNGNQISSTNGTWTDSLGRQIPAMPGAAPTGTAPASTASLSACPALNYSNQAVTSAYTWNLPTVGGATLPLVLCYTGVWVRTNFVTTGSSSGPHFFDVNQSFAMLQSVVFPDNTYWAFRYDAADPNNTSSIAFGDLLKVTFPTGGTITYTWQGWPGCVSQNTPPGGSFSRAVQTRTLDAADGTGPHTWQYSYSLPVGTSSSLSGQTVVTDPANNDTVHVITGLGNTCSLYETQTQYYQGSHSNSGTLLKKVTTDYQFTVNPYDPIAITNNGTNSFADSVANVFPIRVTTALANGLVSKVETDYDKAVAYHGPVDGITSNVNECPSTGDSGAGHTVMYPPVTSPPPTGTACWGAQQTNPVTNYAGSFGKVVAEREYDWGQGAPGPLLRQTQTTYLWQTNSNYLSNNFLDLVSSTTVLDGSGNQVAQTTYGYDEFSLNSSNISTQHDGSPANGSIRGNQTSVHHWLNGSVASTATCSTSVSNGFLVTYTQYNDTGTVYQVTDACGSGAGDKSHTITHTYDPTYAGAFPTQTCNQVGQCLKGIYDFNTGLLTSLTNVNGQTTNYAYDNRWRITQAVFPADPQGNHPETDFSYPDVRTVQRTRKLTSNQNIVDYAYFDGVGRTIQTRLADPEGDDFVDTTYDSLGRVSTVSNPHRSTGSATDGITTTHYDALGRPIQTVKQDGSIASVAYEQAAAVSSNTNCMLATDEAGNPRQTCVDAIGRLIEVDEPAANSGSAGAVATGTGNITGSEQSAQVVVTPAIPGSGNVTLGGGPVQWKAVSNATTGGTTSITITGTEQQRPTGITPGSATVTISTSTNGEQVIPATTAGASVSISGTLQNRAATYATGSVSISGSEGSVTTTTTTCGAPYTIDGGCTTRTTSRTTYDSGSVTISINATGYTCSYNSTTNTSSTAIASCLAGLINGGSLAQATLSGSTVQIRANGAGATGNYSLSASTTHSIPNPSYSVSTSGSALSGGANTVYDSGTTTITVNGVAYSFGWSGSGTTAASIASGLVSALGGNSLVTASASGGTVSIAARNAGSVGNYSLSAGTSFDSGDFGSSSFSVSASGSALSGGKDPVYDAGSITVTVNNHSDSVSWGQGDTTSTLAANLVKAINGDTGAAVTASASGATLTVTSITKGTIGNYPLGVAVKQTATGFSSASFTPSASGAALTGGWPNPNAVDAGTMTLAVGSKNYSVNWGQSDTPGSIASNLAAAITNDPSVTATLAGNTLYLNPNQPGTTTYAFSTANTYDSADFAQASFSPANSIADYGTTSVTVAGHNDSVWWSAGTTPTSLATALTNQINGDSSAQVTATAVTSSAAQCGTPPPITAGNSLVSFADSNGGQHWAYFDINHHVCNLSWSQSGGYSYFDVTATASAPAAAANSGLAGFGDLNGGLHWAYVDGNGHVQNLVWSANGSSSVTDVTAAANATAARNGSPMAAFADPGGGQHWAYLDANQHVNSLAWSSGGGLCGGSGSHRDNRSSDGSFG